MWTCCSTSPKVLPYEPVPFYHYQMPTPMDIDSVPDPPKPRTQTPPRKRKAYIPKAVRVAVWNTYIGEHLGRAKCTVCNHMDITQMNFHCAHVVAESKGGEISVDNLRPTCASCNLSMKTMNLNEFKQKYFG